MTDAAAPRRHSRKGLYLPFVIVGLLLAAWTGWWFVLAREAESRLTQQAERMRQSGWSVVYAGPRISGWPFRARIEARDVSLIAPSTHALAAPVLVAEANAYRPDRWVVIVPDGLVLTRAAKGKVAVDGDAIRASASGLTRAFPNIAVEMVNPRFTAHPGAEPFPLTSADRIELYLREHPAEVADAASVAATDGGVDVLFRLVEARGRGGGAIAGMSGQGRLSAQIETRVTHPDELRRAGPDGLMASWSGAGGRFLDTRGEISAGNSRATLTADALSADQAGRLSGQVVLTAERPLEALAGLARSGAPGLNPMAVAGAAATTAVPAGAEERPISLTLIFRNGRTYLGPFALAPAPRLF